MVTLMDRGMDMEIYVSVFVVVCDEATRSHVTHDAVTRGHVTRHEVTRVHVIRDDVTRVTHGHVIRDDLTLRNRTSDI